MAYSPIEQGRLLNKRALAAVGERHEATPAQVALAWVLRENNVIAIPQSAEPDHIRENRAALDLKLTGADIKELDGAFPPPRRKRALEMI
jgi:diketogulonate reductase-like aldo/keto reductase